MVWIGEEWVFASELKAFEFSLGVGHGSSKVWVVFLFFFHRRVLYQDCYGCFSSRASERWECVL